MAVSCGAKCAKVLLIIFNVIFWLSGAVLLAAGIFVLVEYERATLYQLIPLAGDERNYALQQYLAYGLVGIGGLIFLIGFCGCCGAVRESRCMLVTYFVFLFIILAAELAVGILAVIFQDKVISEMKSGMTEKLQQKYGVSSSLTTAFDLAQVRFKCCGVEGPGDYAVSRWKTEMNRGQGYNVSKTCCVLKNEHEEMSHMHPEPLNDTICQDVDYQDDGTYRHKMGCIFALENFVKTESLVLIGLGCGLAALEIIGMVSAICLCKEI